MDLTRLQSLAEEGLSQRGIAQSMGVSQSTVKYWLNRHGMKTTHTPWAAKPDGERSKICQLCGSGIRNNTRNRTWCCSCYTKIRRVRTKMAAIAYKGGVCEDCGWSGHIAAMEFHHCCGTKEFSFSNIANRRWEVVRAELDKCILLCSRCHHIRHSAAGDARLIEVAASYQGRLLEFS